MNIFNLFHIHVSKPNLRQLINTLQIKLVDARACHASAVQDFEVVSDAKNMLFERIQILERDYVKVSGQLRASESLRSAANESRDRLFAENCELKQQLQALHNSRAVEQSVQQALQSMFPISGLQPITPEPKKDEAPDESTLQPSAVPLCRNFTKREFTGHPFQHLGTEGGTWTSPKLETRSDPVVEVLPEHPESESKEPDSDNLGPDEADGSEPMAGDKRTD